MPTIMQSIAYIPKKLLIVNKVEIAKSHRERKRSTLYVLFVPLIVRGWLVYIL